MSRRGALLTAALVVIVAVAGAGLVSCRDHAEPTAAPDPGRPAEAPVLRCNGDEAFCDLTLDRVVFPGTHNSMSSVAYPGWLFGEQGQPVRAQLDSGIRALLVDTYYGRLDEPRSQEAGRPIVTSAVDGDIFLCHAHCELGATAFGDVLGDLKAFLDANPTEVVVLIVQDATSPADTAAAIAAAGLADRAVTLPHGAGTLPAGAGTLPHGAGTLPASAGRGDQLPTLGELVKTRKNLVVFAEKGGRGAPAWYQRAFDWFQETPFAFTDAAQMGCEANRGPADAPLFLVNHWVVTSPPDPAVAAAVNARPQLEDRFRRCLAERGRLPNVVAVDFADQGDVVATLRDLNRSLTR
ncbi:MAG: hypothetical protein QOJ69_1865 [Actinomycetota bacterium]|nr:hypothetical protein [Actinomycetota bacterium]